MIAHPARADEAEQAVLGAILSSGRREVESLNLRSEDFYQPRNAMVFDAIRRVIQAGNRPDMVAVRMAIPTNALKGEDVGVFLANLVEACPLGAQVDYYAAQVAAAADRRGLQGITVRMAQMVDDGLETSDIMDRVRKMLDHAPRRGGSDSKTWDDINPRVLEHIELGARKGLRTPWPDLNHHLTGLVGSRLYTVAARPGEGKSLVAQAIAVFTATHLRKPVLFASLEMSELDLGVRVYADKASVPMNVLLSGTAAPSQWDAISETSRELASMGCHVNDDPDQSVAQIRAEARGIKDLGLIVVDYLQLVTPANKRADRREQVDQIARDLKLLAKELDVPVLALAQLNRLNQQRSDMTPRLSDLRESGAIEQDSDVVILMQLDPETSELTATVAKNRHGTKGQVALHLWGHYARVEQADGREAI